MAKPNADTLAQRIRPLHEAALSFVPGGRVEALMRQWLRHAAAPDSPDEAARCLSNAETLANAHAPWMPSATGSTAYDRLARTTSTLSSAERDLLTALRSAALCIGRIESSGDILLLHDEVSGRALPIGKHDAPAGLIERTVMVRLLTLPDGRHMIGDVGVGLDDAALAVARGFMRSGRGLTNPVRCQEAVLQHVVRHGGSALLQAGEQPNRLPFQPDQNPLDALAFAWSEMWGSETSGEPDAAEQEKARIMTGQGPILDALISVIIAQDAGKPRLAVAYRRIARLMMETIALREAHGSGVGRLDELSAAVQAKIGSGEFPPQIRTLFGTLLQEISGGAGSKGQRSGSSGSRSQNVDLERLIQRIQALRAKTVAQGCTEQEALAAAEKAAELLDRYGLSLSELQWREQACEGLGVETGRRRRAPIDDCIPMVAQFFDCRVWGETGTGGTMRYVFFGLRADVQAALYLHDLVALAFDTETGVFRSSEVYRETHASQRRTASNSFQIGFSRGIIRKLQTLREAREAMLRRGSGRDLVPMKETIVDEELARLGLKFRHKSVARRSVLQDAFAAGQEAGKRFDYTPGITTE